jgi:hypothetical protein
MKYIKKTLIFLTFTFLLNFTFADENESNSKYFNQTEDDFYDLDNSCNLDNSETITKSKDENSFKNKCDKEIDTKPFCCDQMQSLTESMQEGYNAPYKLKLCDPKDFFFSVSFIYWQPIQEDLNPSVDDPFTASQINGRYISLEYEFKPSFKALIGHNLDCDNLKILLQYTRLNMNTTTSANKQDGFDLTNEWILSFSAGSNISKVTNKWNLDFNILDFELSRAFYNGKILTMDFIYGFKSGIINQKLFSTANFPDPLNAQTQSDSYLIGPRAGIDSNFIFLKHYRFFTNIKTSILYQKFHKVSYKEEDENDTSLILLDYSSKFKDINLAMESAIGFAVGKYFYDKTFFLDASLAYEAQIYFDQNKIGFYLSSLAGSFRMPKANNLNLHGLTLTFKFDF